VGGPGRVAAGPVPPRRGRSGGARSGGARSGMRWAGLGGAVPGRMAHEPRPGEVAVEPAGGRSARARVAPVRLRGIAGDGRPGARLALLGRRARLGVLAGGIATRHRPLRQPGAMRRREARSRAAAARRRVGVASGQPRTYPMSPRC
jgi:hypothetical protein